MGKVVRIIDYQRKESTVHFNACGAPVIVLPRAHAIECEPKNSASSRKLLPPLFLVEPKK